MSSIMNGRLNKEGEFYMKVLWELYAAFFKVGLLTFGGGYAMLPVANKEVSAKKGWAAEEEILDFFTISQALPGLIAVNTSLFIGNKVKGMAGGIACVLGVITPSIIIILTAAAFLKTFFNNPIVGRALLGIQAVVCAFILDALLKLRKSIIKNAFTVLLFLITFVLSAFHMAPIAVLIIFAAAVCVIKETFAASAANNRNKKR